MTTVTADDIRVLAQSGAEDPVLLLTGGEVRVVAAGEVDPDTPGKVIYTRADLVAEFGEEVTDVEAETLAAGLTARLADGTDLVDPTGPVDQGDLSDISPGGRDRTP